MVILVLLAIRNNARVGRGQAGFVQVREVAQAENARDGNARGAFIEQDGGHRGRVHVEPGPHEREGDRQQGCQPGQPKTQVGEEGDMLPVWTRGAIYPAVVLKTLPGEKIV